MAEPVLISGALLGSRELVAELGGDADALAREARLPSRVFDEPDIFVPAAYIVDFLELAARACACPEFALRHARRLPLGLRGLGIRGQGWMLMRAAQTVREALQDFVNIYGLYTDAGSLHLKAQRGDLWLSYIFAPVGRWGETQITHLTLARMCLFIGESLSTEWRPRQVSLRHDPADRTPYHEFFGPDVSFGQNRDAILIDHETLAAHIVTQSPHRIGGKPVVARLDLDGPALMLEVKALLGALLRHEDCSIEVLGAALGLSQRTLQRRLTAAGTSYRELLDTVRADLAWRHVKRTGLSFARVADLLGYDSQAAFSRAFRRWYDMTPRAARSG